MENGSIVQNQSGFKPGDSCINQLLSITHEIFKLFDGGWEVRGVFLDISKAFAVNTKVPQGSVFLLFLTYTNDLSTALSSEFRQMNLLQMKKFSFFGCPSYDLIS